MALQIKVILSVIAFTLFISWISYLLLIDSKTDTPYIDNKGSIMFCGESFIYNMNNITDTTFNGEKEVEIMETASFYRCPELTKIDRTIIPTKENILMLYSLSGALCSINYNIHPRYHKLLFNACREQYSSSF